MTAWNDMYTQFSRNMHTMNEIYNEYINNVKNFNKLLDETNKNVNRMNEIYMDLIKANQDMYNLYKENFDIIMKFNQQWLEIFWGPFLGKQQQREQARKQEQEKPVSEKGGND